MQQQQHDVGDRPRFVFRFRDYSATLTDPVVVRVVVRAPGTPATETEYVYGTDPAIERISVGVYRFTLPLTVKGQWSVRFHGMHGPTPEETIVATDLELLVRSASVTAVFPTP